MEIAFEREREKGFVLYGAVITVFLGYGGFVEFFWGFVLRFLLFSV